jgi:hypothetical protein
VLDGFGRAPNPADPVPVSAADFAGRGARRASGALPAGERVAALNAGGPLALAEWPGARVEDAAQLPGLDLRGWLIALAALLFGAGRIGQRMAGARHRKRAAA